MGYKRRCNKVIQARVPEKLFNDFDKACKKGYLSKSDVIRNLIEKYIKDSNMAITINI